MSEYIDIRSTCKVCGKITTCQATQAEAKALGFYDGMNVICEQCWTEHMNQWTKEQDRKIAETRAVSVR